MNTLYTDLQKLVQDHCEKVVCVNGALLAKDLRTLIAHHNPKPTIDLDVPLEDAYE